MKKKRWNDFAYRSGVFNFMTSTSAATAATTLRKDSAVDKFHIFGREIYIKRDDQLTFPEDIGITGNKVRKFQSLYAFGNTAAAPATTTNEFDHSQSIPTMSTSCKFPSVVYSCGGNQSNAMRALALLCRYKGSQLIYFTRTISKQLKQRPQGNYGDALAAGMQIVELPKAELQAFSKYTSLADLPSQYRSEKDEKTALFIPQGAASPIAQEGIYRLCQEIEGFIRSKAALSSKPWKLLFASGTGVSAFYASKYFQDQRSLSQSNDSLLPEVQVIAIPCVTDEDGLLNELHYIANQTNTLPNSFHFPMILSTKNCLIKRQFGTVYDDYFELWKRLQEETTITFDLLYAVRAWEVILSQLTPISLEYDLKSRLTSSTQPALLESWEKDYHLLYYHCGGLEGNPSALSRYQSSLNSVTEKRFPKKKKM